MSKEQIWKTSRKRSLRTTSLFLSRLFLANHKINNLVFKMNRLQALEAESRKLEHSSAARTSITQHVIEYVESFCDKLPDLPAFLGDVEPQKQDHKSFPSEEGTTIKAILHELENTVDANGIHLSSGRYMGYIPGGGLYGAALGDLIAAVTNRFSGLYFASPGAVALENSLVRWMCKVVGYPDSAGGTLTSGGSISNLIALVTCRDALHMNDSHSEKSVVYCTGQAHHSIHKAIHIAGLGRSIIRQINVDSGFRMRSSDLAEAIVNDREQGLRPCLVIATAGTTNCGAVDPIMDIASIARENQLWLHVDGAYGGLFNLCPEGSHVLQGIECSDSISLDPHKTLFLPYGTGTILVRDRRKLFASFNASADYLLDFPDHDSEWSPADLSPELSRHFRGLRLWLPLKLHGISPFRAALSEKIHLARYFHQTIRELKGFESDLSPDLSIVTYRYVPKFGDPDRFNDRLMKAVVQSGKAFVSSTRLHGHLVLRAAILSFRTHREHVDALLETLQREVAELEQR